MIGPLISDAGFIRIPIVVSVAVDVCGVRGVGGARIILNMYCEVATA